MNKWTVLELVKKTLQENIDKEEGVISFGTAVSHKTGEIAIYILGKDGAKIDLFIQTH